MFSDSFMPIFAETQRLRGSPQATVMSHVHSGSTIGLHGGPFHKEVKTWRY